MFPFISKLSAILQQRGVIRIQSNIYDEDFLQKYWTAFSLIIFENNFTADVRIGSNTPMNTTQYLESIQK